jgi:uncharacterized membrane protein
MRKSLLLLLLLSIAEVASAREGMTWIYRHDDDLHMRSVNDRAPDTDSLSRRYGSEFVWIRRDGHAYVITDRTVLATIRDVFRERDEFNDKLDAVQVRLERRVREVEEIGEELGDRDLSESARHAIEARLRDAEQRMRDVERDMRAVEREMKHAADESNVRFMEIVERAIVDGDAERAD